MDRDRDYLENEGGKIQEEEDKFVDEAISIREDILDEEQRDILNREQRVKYTGELFRDKEEWKKGLFKLKKFKVLKM